MPESEDEGEADADVEDDVEEDDADAGPSTKSSKKTIALAEKAASSPPPAKKSKRDGDEDANEGTCAFCYLFFVVLRIWSFGVSVGWIGRSLLISNFFSFCTFCAISSHRPFFYPPSSFNGQGSLSGFPPRLGALLNHHLFFSMVPLPFSSDCFW